MLGLGALALGACHSKPASQAANQDLSIDDNLTTGQLPANAEIETLPPDESSEASNGELSRGQDNPDVNDIGNGN
ncbi:hypothetical protein [Sphingomonas agri]|uniref:hypothetical protein n=1 Tax=Sphingomonas agri TaxID=1813878 RepID=UPI00311D2C82